MDTLKIDRSFVIDTTAAPEGMALACTIINPVSFVRRKRGGDATQKPEKYFAKRCSGGLADVCLRSAQLDVEVAQGLAQSFFDDRMIERHLAHLRDGHFVL